MNFAVFMRLTWVKRLIHLANLNGVSVKSGSKNISRATQLNDRHWLRSKKAKQVFSFSRWLHIYISCALFSLLIFFCITGITLNHPNWAGSATNTIKSLTLPEQLSQTINGEFQVNAIQRFIEANSQLSNPRTVDIAFDYGEITYDYPLPAGYAFATVLVEENLIEIEYANSGLIALFNDLHKGRHSGDSWSWLIDVSALLMTLFSLTGLIIVFQNAKHRRQATALLLLGSITPVVIYLAFVPK